MSSLQAQRTLPKTDPTAMTNADSVNMPDTLATGMPTHFT